jgi:hypothetical protein
MLGLADRALFFDGAWDNEVCVGRATAKDVVDVFGHSQLEQAILSSLSLRADHVSLIHKNVARPVQANSNAIDLVATALRAGQTILASNINIFVPSLADLCRCVESSLAECGVILAEAVTANAYLSPPSAQGFGLHYDNHCAIVVQVRGSKRWQIYAPNPPHPLKRCTTLIDPEKMGPPTRDLVLKASDVMYIPRGHPHQARSGVDGSLHITLSVHPVTWADHIAQLAERLPELRQAITPLRRPEALHEKFVNIISQLATIDPVPTAREQLAHSISSQWPLATSRLVEANCDPNIESDTELIRCVLCVALSDGARSSLHYPGDVAYLDEVMFPVFAFVESNERFRVEDLPSIPFEYDRVCFVKHLVRRGILRVA